MLSIHRYSWEILPWSGLIGMKCKTTNRWDDYGTFPPGFGNDISCWFAHHFRNIQWTVGLFSYGNGTIYCLSFHLKYSNDTHIISSFHNIWSRTLTFVPGVPTGVLGCYCMCVFWVCIPPQGETERVLLVQWCPGWEVSSAPKRKHKTIKIRIQYLSTGRRRALRWLRLLCHLSTVLPHQWCLHSQHGPVRWLQDPWGPQTLHRA